MAEAAAKEPTMEDILASIRKIISQDDAKSQAAAATATPAARPYSSPQAGGSERAAAREYLSASQGSQPAPAVRAPDRQPPLPRLAEGQPAPTARPAAATTLAALASQVKNQMPRPEPQARPDNGADARSHAQQPAQQPVSQPPLSQPPRAASAPAAASSHPAIASVSAQSTPRPAPQPAATAPAQAAQPPQDPEMSAFRDALVSPSTKSAVSQSFDRLKRATADNMDAKIEAVLRPMLREWMDENLPTLVERLVRQEIERIARG